MVRYFELLLFLLYRQQNGKSYLKASMINIRSAINRHLQSAPYNRPLTITADKEFLVSNQVFNAVLKKLRETGKETTKHHPAIEQIPIEKLYSSGVLATNEPKALLNKTFFLNTVSLWA